MDSKEKRLFEAELNHAPALKVQPRALRKGPGAAKDQAFDGLPETANSQQSFTFSREMILRLIDWMKDV